MQSCLSICLLLIAIQIEEHDKDKRRAMKKVLAEHTSKSKLKEKMLVRTENGTFFFCFFFFYCFSIASLSWIHVDWNTVIQQTSWREYFLHKI